ncbi:MAG: spermidine/putrescine ABC transporter substrate-binding protein [Christensenellaceae bacterium]|nr:spermidine/putrescine ABC transporter substrate-binding protein [Christensenellaceae bacterium]
MKKLILMAMVFALLLPVCASADEVVNVFNWEDYIDESVLKMFEEETGIHVNYMNFTTNEDMIVQIEAHPGEFDLCFPSDYIIERMIAKGMAAEINFDNIPNFDQVLPHLLNPDYDPTNQYSVPYMWGTVGILYNKTMIADPERSWHILWDEQYQNSVFMMDSIRDSIGVTLKYLGYSLNTREVPELMAAKNKLIEQKTSGVVKAYQVDETKDKMVAGEAPLALMWSGDAQYAIDLNDDLDYFVPQEGSNIWVDGMVIPAGAQNKENAEKLINFLCRPDIAQMNCDYIRYSSVNAGAIELMGEDYTSNYVMNPAQEVIDNCEFFHDIDDSFRAVYESLWMEVKNTK